MGSSHGQSCVSGDLCDDGRWSRPNKSQNITSKGQISWEGAVKEVKAKIRSESHSASESQHACVACLARCADHQLVPPWRGRTDAVPKKNGQELSTSSCTTLAECHVDGERQRRESDWFRESLA